MMVCRFLALGVATLWLGTALAQSLEIIELRYRLADQVLPTLLPLVEPGGVLTGTESTLFLRTSPENVEQIRQAVALLDREPRQLVVSVGQGTVETIDAADVRGSATIGSGDLQVGVNRPPASTSGAELRASQVTQRANLDNVSTVRTIEGSEAWIAIGQLAPLTTTQVVPGWHGPTVVESTEYRSVSTGFYATARLTGDDRVTLELSPQQQRLRSSSYGTVIDTAGTVTTVSGRLGEWLPLGAVQETRASNESGLLVWGRRSSASEYGAWVKVDAVP